MNKFFLVLAASLACTRPGRRVKPFERLQSITFVQNNVERAQRGKSLESQEPMKLLAFQEPTKLLAFNAPQEPMKLLAFQEPMKLLAFNPSTEGIKANAETDSGDTDDADADGGGQSSSSDDAGEGEEDENEVEPEPEQKISRIVIIEHYQEPEQKAPKNLAPPQRGGAGEGVSTPTGKTQNTLTRRLEQAGLPQEAKEVADRELQRLRKMPTSHPEHSTLTEYLEWIADLPWNKSAEDRLTISAARDQLQADHFGMERVKARILEYLSVCKLKGDMRGNILCLHGPPGIGKTSLGRSIAAALQRDFYRVSLGGVHSEAEVRGHRRTYVGAMPGLILQALKKCGTNNCVIMLDEIDKLGRQSLNGDPSAALLEVLDPEQNHAFRDHFLNLPFDVSRVLFIATANELAPIPRALRDRMEVIEMSGYTVEEKIHIARDHLLPKQRKNHGLGDSDIDVEEPAIDALISGYTRESGVRELDRQLAALCRSVAARTAEAAEAAEAEAETTGEPSAGNEIADVESSDAEVEDTTGSHDDSATEADGDRDVEDTNTSDTAGVLHAEDLIDILGPPKYDGPRDNIDREWKAGIATGLAYTAVGGDVLFVEAETMTGRGELTITGSLGDVMAESVKIATGWVRAHAKELGIPEGAVGSSGMLLNGTDLHIHFPAGATPKDGPSAGVTIATAIVSLLTGRLVRPDLAMTGEITLRGLVLPVGGIKEKLIAAHRAGMKHALIPAKNEKDLRELPASVLDEMKVSLMRDIEDVLAVALLPAGEGVPMEHAEEEALELVD